MALAILFSLLAAVGFGSSSVFARLGLQRVRSNSGTFLSSIASFVIAAVPAAVFSGDAITTLAAGAFLGLFIYGLITFPLGRYFNFIAVNLAGATRASPLLAASPVFAAGVAMIALGERPNLWIILGTLVTTAGVALIVSEARRREG